jgi:hypothetical protein
MVRDDGDKAAVAKKNFKFNYMLLKTIKRAGFPKEPKEKNIV